MPKNSLKKDLMALAIITGIACLAGGTTFVGVAGGLRWVRRALTPPEIGHATSEEMGVLAVMPIERGRRDLHSH